MYHLSEAFIYSAIQADIAQSISRAQYLINGTAREENNSMGCKTFPRASQNRFNDTQFLFMDRHCHKVDAMYGPCLEREFALSRVGSCRAKRSMGYGLQNLCLDFASQGPFKGARFDICRIKRHMSDSVEEHS